MSLFYGFCSGACSRSNDSKATRGKDFWYFKFKHVYLFFYMQRDAVQSFCKLCTRTVSSLSQIPTHVDECHPKSKQCPICKKRFPSVKRAQNHTRLHFPASDVEPKEYRCQYCEKLFKESGKLNRHIESIHAVRTEPWCQKSFLIQFSKLTGQSGREKFWMPSVQQAISITYY